ncbi:GntR family transcriptional regulator [Pseudaestuariivita sp.]|uniref:GntR family transcriptional regulator n=1 Tax=Pseudaestuariivita sp. TaxID=2211669 RepID=UPI00405A06EF
MYTLKPDRKTGKTETSGATLTEVATERLRSAILAGTLGDGNLTENDLCESLQMSRTPVRAALQVLAQEGLLSYAPQRGFQIRRQDAGLVSEAYDVRSVLEGLAARRVAERGLDTDTEVALTACVTLGAELLETTPFDLARWREMNTRFHETIIEAASIDLLRAAARLAEGVPLAAMSVVADLDPAPDHALLQQAQNDHAALLAALRNGQSARAEARMREHIVVAGELIAAALTERTSPT